MDLHSFITKNKKLNDIENIKHVKYYNGQTKSIDSLFNILNCRNSFKRYTHSKDCIVIHNFDKNKLGDLKNKLNKSLTCKYVIVANEFYSFCVYHESDIYIIFSFINYNDFVNFLDVIVHGIDKISNSIIKIDTHSILQLKDYNWNTLYVQITDFHEKVCTENVLNNINNLIVPYSKDENSYKKLQNSDIIGLGICIEYSLQIPEIINSCKYLSELNINFVAGYLEMCLKIDEKFLSEICKHPSLVSLSLNCFGIEMKLSDIFYTVFSNNTITFLKIFIMNKVPTYMNMGRRFNMNKIYNFDDKCITVLNNIKNVIIDMKYNVINITYDSLMQLCECVKTNELIIKVDFHIVFPENISIEKCRKMILSLYDTYKYNQYSYLIAVIGLQEYVSSHKELDIKLNDVRSTYIISQTLVDLCK